MDSDLKVIMHELTNLKRQAEAGKIDRERWLRVMDIQSPAMAESEE